MDSWVKWHQISTLPGDILVSLPGGTKVAAELASLCLHSAAASPRAKCQWLPVQSHCTATGDFTRGKKGKPGPAERARAGAQKGQVGFGKGHEK